MKYIDADKLIVEIKRYKNKADERLKIKGRTFGVEQKDLALQNLCGNLLYFITSLQQDETQVDKMLCSQVWWEEQGWIMIPPDATIEGIDSLLRQVKKKLQQEQPEVEMLGKTLDEAAKQFQRRWDNDQSPEASFKAGAEWMAGQGITFEGKASRRYENGLAGFVSWILFDQQKAAHLLVNQGEEADVIINIRKK